jgi:hypothetical protein
MITKDYFIDTLITDIAMLFLVVFSGYMIFIHKQPTPKYYEFVDVFNNYGTSVDCKPREMACMLEDGSWLPVKEIRSVYNNEI